MKRPTLCALGLWLWLGAAAAPPALAGPLPFEELLPRAQAELSHVRYHLTTSWGFGPRENHYNELIEEAVKVSWSDAESPLPPLLYKSLMAVESAFKPDAVSSAGAAGLAQLMPDTAKRFGLTHRDRLDPYKALPAGIAALEEKHRVICDPGNYYAVVGMSPKPCPWGDKVASAYSRFGMPEGEDRWYLVLGAYNGGGGTILRAMARTYDKGLDPRKWDNVAGPPGHCLHTPLHEACCEVFGSRSSDAKARELANYPRKIFGYFHRSGT